MRLAYADPPYPGMARKFYSRDPRCAEVNHPLLVAHLESYDGWALSTSAATLQKVLALCPSGVRVASWVKPFFCLKPNWGSGTSQYSPGYAWEPVIFKPARVCVRPCRDWLAANTPLKAGCPGAKPVSFAYWLFDLVGAEASDSFDDLFPGSGIVGRAWKVFSEPSSHLELVSECHPSEASVPVWCKS